LLAGLYFFIEKRTYVCYDYKSICHRKEKILMLTIKQKKVLDIINEYIEKNKISPTIREIQELVGLKSTSTIHEYIKRLEKKGYISRIDASPRSIKVEKRD